MVVADTSAVVAFLDRSDAHHAAARQRFAAEEHVAIPTEVLVETIGVIKVKGGRKAAERALVDLMRMENVGWEETSDLSAAYRIYRDHKTRSLVDAFVLHLCVRSEKAIFTFDKDQEAILGRLRP